MYKIESAFKDAKQLVLENINKTELANHAVHELVLTFFNQSLMLFLPNERCSKLYISVMF